MLVNRRSLPPREIPYTAAVPVTSNGGALNLDLSMEVTRAVYPIPVVSPRLLLFLGPEATEQQFGVSNLLRSGGAAWEIGKITYHREAEKDWLSVSPASGYASTDTNMITVTAVREGLPPGLYSAGIQVKTCSGEANVTVIMLVQPGETVYPELRLSRSMLWFLDRDTSEQSFIITNGSSDGTSGTLDWRIDAENIGYVLGNGTGWISSIGPLTGQTTTEEDEVAVTVSRAGLSAGLYAAVVPVTSDGGNRNMYVYLLVPLF